MRTIRVGLSQRLEWLESRREMRETLDVAWGERLAALGAQALALPTRGSAPDALLRDYGVQALILTGGNEAGAQATDVASKVRAEREAGLLQAAHAAGVPVLGVCHGMQVMNLHLGGHVSTIEHHVRAPHGLSGAAARILGVTRVNSFHNIGIQPRELAGALLPVGVAPDASVEAAVHRDLPWLGVMWHPEREMPGGADGMAAVAAFLDDPAGVCRRLRAEASA